MDRNETTLSLWSIITFAGLLLYKNFLIDEYQILLYYNIFTDLLLLAIVFTLSIHRQSILQQKVQSIIAFCIIFYHWLDSCIYIAINHRLTLNNIIDAVHSINVNYLQNVISTKLVIFTLIILFVAIILRKRTVTLPFAPSPVNMICYELLLVLTLGSFLARNVSTMHNEDLAINLANTAYTATSLNPDTLNTIATKSPGLIQRIHDYFNGKTQIPLNTGHKIKPNIIVVISESLSMVDSKYVGGLFNRLPLIDKIQEDGLGFKHCVANGKITAHGLASFFLGLQSTKTSSEDITTQFPVDKFSGNNIVEYAKKLGYHPIIITLRTPEHFSQMNAWFKNLGFETIYDPNSTLLKDEPRFTWNAPSDQSLYQATLKLLPQLKKPYFLVLQTISLHPEYSLPDPKYSLGKNKLLNLINYVDGTTYNFYQAIKKQGYLSDGYFVLFSNHRRSEPLEKLELDDGGYSIWHQRIVCSIVGNGIPAHTITSIPFSLIDMNTLMHTIMNDKPVNDKTLHEASLSGQLGIDSPFNVSLVDEAHGTYLVRSENYPPLYISIYGKVPFQQLPNHTYRDVVTYLIENDQYFSRMNASSKPLEEQQ